MKKSGVFAVLALAVLLSSSFFPATYAAPSQVPQQAASVVLSIIPPKLPADGGSYAAVVVSLADKSGLPSAALTQIVVFLSSSQINIASVPDSVIIGPGQEYAMANVTTTPTPGTAMITAHAQGLGAPQSAPITTVTPSGFPSKLKVFTSPSEFLPRSDVGSVRVEVVDDAGLPSKAISDITVQLTSSNSSIASLDQSTLVIPAGSIYTTGTLHTSGHGAAVISAASTG
ncbi:MAG TPA: hypothetical protein VFE91_05520, partial [Nitrososphaerales archaeon]|nr:hypothetical protein [Nitrososphaerales archaeon]